MGSTSEEFFPCSLSSRQRIMSMAGILISTVPLLIVILSLPLMAARTGQEGAMKGAAIFMLPFTLLLSVIVVFLIVGARFAPRGYLVEPEGIAILRRNGRRITLSVQNVTSMEIIDQQDIRKGCIRTFGVGGYFGSWGDFYCTKLGSFRCYCTNSNFVLIRTSDQGLFVLSPDAREEFIECASQSLATSHART